MHQPWVQPEQALVIIIYDTLILNDIKGIKFFKIICAKGFGGFGSTGQTTSSGLTGFGSLGTTNPTSGTTGFSTFGSSTPSTGLFQGFGSTNTAPGKNVIMITVQSIFRCTFVKLQSY